MQTNEQKLNQYRTPDDIVFDKHWFSKHQSKLLWLANSFIGKYIFRFKKMGHYLDPKKKISKITPYSVAQQNKGNEYTEHFFSRNEYARKLYFVLLPMWYVMHIWDWFVADHFQLAPQLSFGFSTLTKYVGSIGTNNPIDASIRRGSVNDTWSTIWGYASGNTVRYGSSDNSGIVSIYASATTNKYSRIERGLLCYDTSSLGSGVIISDTVLSLSGDTRGQGLYTAPSLHIAGATPANTNDAVVGDYAQCGATSFGSVAYASWTIDRTYTDITLDANGRNNVSKTGISSFSVRIDKDMTNTEPTWKDSLTDSFAWMGSGFGSNIPKLVVTYTTAVAPTVTTEAVSSIAQTTATGNGTVTADGGATITERGVCWSATSGTETAGGSHATSGGTTGAFTASITGLTANTTYYVKAYAINSVGTSYGSEVSFATLAAGPANVKTINGLATASAKTVNGLATASVKSIMGLN